MSTRPRYVQDEVLKWDDTDVNAVVDHVRAGETLTGFFAYPYSYLIRGLGGGFYDAINSIGTRVYGGPDDQGGVDGGDPTAVLSAAFNAAAEVDGSVKVCSGTYAVNAFLDLDLVGHKLQVYGDDALLQLAEGKFIRVEGGDAFKWDGLILDGQDLATSVGIYLGYNGSGTDNVEISGCSFLNFLHPTTNYEGYGIYDTDGMNRWIHHNIFNSCGQSIVGVGGAEPNNIFIHHNMIKDYRATGINLESETADGFHSVFIDHNILDGLNSEERVPAGRTAINVYAADGLAGSHVNINSNIIREKTGTASGNGILVSRVNNGSICDNTITGCKYVSFPVGYAAICIRASTKIVIDGNTIDDCENGITELNIGAETSDYNTIGVNHISNINTDIGHIVGAHTSCQKIVVPFIYGTAYETFGGHGWDVDAAGEYAVAHISFPAGVHQPVRVRVHAVSIVTEADAMTAVLSYYGGGDNEAEATHTTYSGDFASATENFAAGDNIKWEWTKNEYTTDGWLLHEGDSAYIKMVGRVLSGGNCATDARFRTVEIDFT
jgi:hypothetical protein